MGRYLVVCRRLWVGGAVVCGLCLSWWASVCSTSPVVLFGSPSTSTPCGRQCVSRRGRRRWRSPPPGPLAAHDGFAVGCVLNGAFVVVACTAVPRSLLVGSGFARRLVARSSPKHLVRGFVRCGWCRTALLSGPVVHSVVGSGYSGTSVGC